MKYHRLSTEERYELAALRRQNLGMGKMAEHLGRHRSTLYREVKRNQSVHDGSYRPSHAVEKASGRKQRSRRNWLYGPGEFAPIEVLLRQRLSPEQIVGRRRGCLREVACLVPSVSEQISTRGEVIMSLRQSPRRRFDRIIHSHRAGEGMQLRAIES